MTCTCLWRHFRQEKSFTVEGYKSLRTLTQTQRERDTHTDMHIHTHTHRSITIKAVEIKYKDATNLQTLFTLKWATLFQLQSKDTIFLSNCQIRFNYHKTTNIMNFFIFFHSVFLCGNGTIYIMHTVYSFHTHYHKWYTDKKNPLIWVYSFDIFKQYGMFLSFNS